MARGFPPGWHPRRGEVYFLLLDKDRPAIVLSIEALNRHSLDVCVVPLTTVERPRFSLRVPLEAGTAGLKKRSWAKCDQVTTIEKTFLRYPPCGTVPARTLEQIEEGVSIALGLAEG